MTRRSSLVYGALLVACGYFGGLRGNHADVISAREFQLRDESGRVVARFTEEHGAGRLEFDDRNGQTAGTLGLNVSGGMLHLIGSHGTMMLTTAPTPQLMLVDSTGNPRLEAIVSDNSTGLVLRSAGGMRKLSISQGDQDGIRMTLGGSLALPGGPGGSGDLNPLAEMRVGKDGELSIRLESESAHKSDRVSDWFMCLQPDGSLTVLDREDLLEARPELPRK